MIRNVSSFLARVIGDRTNTVQLHVTESEAWSLVSLLRGESRGDFDAGLSDELSKKLRDALMGETETV